LRSRISSVVTFQRAEKENDKRPESTIAGMMTGDPSDTPHVARVTSVGRPKKGKRVF